MIVFAVVGFYGQGNCRRE